MLAINNLAKSMIILFVIIILTAENSNAQLNSSFTAKEGLFSARNYALGQLGMTDPVLIGIGTINDTIMISGFEIKLGMKLEDGTSGAWSYIFKEKTSDRVKAVGVSKFFGGYYSINLTEEMKILIEEIPKKEINIDWIDTKEVVSILKNNSEFKEYYKANPNLYIQSSLLSVNTNNDELIINDSYWNLTFGNENSYICFVNSITKNVHCISTVTKIVPYDNNEISVYPNPVNNTLNFSDSFLSNFKIEQIEIINIEGKRVLKTNNLIDSKIVVSNLPRGIYNLLIYTGKKLITKKIIITN